MSTTITRGSGGDGASARRNTSPAPSLRRLSTSGGVTAAAAQRTAGSSQGHCARTRGAIGLRCELAHDLAQRTEISTRRLRGSSTSSAVRMRSSDSPCDDTSMSDASTPARVSSVRTALARSRPSA